MLGKEKHAKISITNNIYMYGYRIIYYVKCGTAKQLLISTYSQLIL